jgi:opacity protein-like surface antigen
MKKTVLTAAAALVISAASAFAQNASPPAAPGPGNKAVNSPNTNNSDKPVSGANSFTEGQAKSRIESSGYSKVSDLKKDDNGVWRGKATKDGKSVDVSLDFQGNVTSR